MKLQPLCWISSLFCLAAAVRPSLVVEHINPAENANFGNILSHATKVSAAAALVFVSGQVPVNIDGGLVEGSFEDKVTASLDNATNTLRAAGTDWTKALLVTIFLKDIAKGPEFNKLYEQYLPSPKPARICIQSGKLPNDIDIEIAVIAAA